VEHRSNTNPGAMIPTEPQNRREFVKRFSLLPAVSTLLTASWSNTLLAAVTLPKRPTRGRMLLKISDFPALQDDFGSVRIGTSPVAGIEPTGLLHPILINRGPGGQFHALNSECTHAGCVVRPYSQAAGACICPCHGSRYAIDGARTGGPAFFPLLPYAVQFDGKDQLIIELPDLPHEVHASLVRNDAGSAARLRLEFLAFAHIHYEVMFQPSVSAPWQATPFALTPDGPLDQTVFAGNDDFAVVYVDTALQTGFLTVTMRLQPV
jgi:nitrite reductase/ring-hydroxylating ferredoxin subunit